ncbi:MAG: DUF1611 domain-containing protein [Gemmatimonadetes bacterium]|nr:DUF1611 domain-containing protein [Gemmatimonadota bacterium]
MDEHRYLILAEGHFGPESSKTANSAIRYLPERVLGVVDARNAGRTVQDVLGFGGDIPILSSVEEGFERDASALLIGIAPQGGQLPESWRSPLRAAMAAGLDIVSGLHFYLSDDPEIAGLAAERGVRIHDLRKPPRDIPVATGRARNVDPLVVLTVGTDCNIGKMTAALQIRRSLVDNGARVGFAATGQTGILIEGWGIAVDAVVADFISGAAERLTLQAAEGNDVVLVEGQGSLVHPGYSGVTLGLLHGSMPDALILCHQPSRSCVYGAEGAYDWVPLPSLTESIRIYENAIAPLRESQVVGIALNTWDLTEEEAQAVIARTTEETGLPATDPVRYDPAPLSEAILKCRSKKVRKYESTGVREYERTGIEK